MKAAPFAYRAPESLDETLSLLAPGDGARVLAGGQSLVPLLKARVVKPTLVVDVNRVPGLAGIETEEDGSLRIGALARQQTLLESEEARAAQPLLHAAGRFAGYLATRHRGTVGGSLAFAAPWAELTAAVVALDARLEIRSAHGERAVAARDFFTGPHQTVLEPDELLTAVRIPVAADRTGVGFHEVSARYRDFARVAAAATVTLDDVGNVHGGGTRPSSSGADAVSRGRLSPPRNLDRGRGARRGRGGTRRTRARGRHRGQRCLPEACRGDARTPRAPRRPRESECDAMSDELMVRVEVNGTQHEGLVEPRRTLADFLRDDLDLTGTHVACENGFCGNCNVLLDGETVRSCLMFAVQADGRSLTTVEGLAEPNGTLGRLQQAFHDNHGLQCGFCTPAMLLTAHEYLEEHPDGGTDEQIRDAISGVICRCTGYQHIVESIRAAAGAET